MKNSSGLDVLVARFFKRLFCFNLISPFPDVRKFEIENIDLRLESYFASITDGLTMLNISEMGLFLACFTLKKRYEERAGSELCGRCKR
jgi:hypothetical protein